MMNRSILEGDFDLPSAPFPSLEALPSTSSQRKRKHERTEEPLHFLATSATALSQELSNNNAANKEASRKTKAEELAPKRPVGRPRLHPKKELDPNRVRRGALIVLQGGCFFFIVSICSLNFLFFCLYSREG